MRADCSAVATRTWTSLSQTLPDTHPGKGAWSPETWTWTRVNGIHLKTDPLVFEGSQSLHFPQSEGGNRCLPGWCRDRVKRIFKGKGVRLCYGSRLHLYPGMRPTHLAADCALWQRNAEVTLADSGARCLGSKRSPASRCVTLDRSVNPAVLVPPSGKWRC